MTMFVRLSVCDMRVREDGSVRFTVMLLASE